MISMALRDADPHPAAPIRGELARTGITGDATVNAAKKRLGVKTSKRGFQGASHWQITQSFNSTPNRDSLAPARDVRPTRDCLDPHPHLNPVDSQRIKESLQPNEQQTETPKNLKPPAVRAREALDVDPDPLRRLKRLERYDHLGAQVLGEHLGLDTTTVTETRVEQLLAAFPSSTLEAAA